MKITNKHNLPDELVRACAVGERINTQDRISATELIGSPRVRQLKIRYGDKLEQDATDLLWALLGRGVHAVIEHHEGKNSIAESRLAFEIDGITVSGQSDLYHDIAGGTVEDWKTTSVYAFLLGDKPEWEQQLNIYAWLWRKTGFPVQHLRINAILRDWSKGKSKSQADYPDCPFKTIEIPVWPQEKCEDYVMERLVLHSSARYLPDDDLPECTPAEKWQKPTTYAVMKKGNKRATKVCDTKLEADSVAFGDKNLSVVERPGGCTKCEDFCPVKSMCKYAPKEESV